MEVISYTLQKDGNTPEENEDLSAWMGPGGAPGDTAAVFAASDGSNGSSYSRVFAGYLVTEFCTSPAWDVASFEALVRKCSKKRDYLVNREDLPYYGVMKAAQGSDATFIGLELRADTLSWRCFAIGDTTLLQIRDQELVTSFPMKSSLEFSTSPFLVSSLSGRNTRLWDSIKASRDRFFSGGEYQHDDRFLLMSDAFAAWFLSEQEKGRSPLKEIDPVIRASDGAPRFSSWVQEKRDLREMKNDDTTCLVISP